MRNASRDAIPNAAVSPHEIDADVAASSLWAPPTPSEVFARLGVMVIVALAFGFSAQFLVAGLAH
jgi:hypothetical protein